MHHNEHRDVAIIGGGIGGLTAALSFARMGASVTFYEQAAALTEVGAGLQITPNGARVLDRLGVGKALAASGVSAKAVVPADALTGREITRFDLTSQSPPYRFFHRAVLIDVLARGCQAAGVSFRLGCRVSNVRADGRFDVDGQAVSADLTIGADGLHSVVRPVMNTVAKPFFTGQVAWRALTRVADADAVARVWMAPGRHLVTYPIGNGRLNIVAVQERSRWAAEGWHHADDPGNLRKAFDDCAWQVKGILGEVEHVSLWGLFRHPVAQNWRMGTVAILGDAAHPTLPFLAQGANLAIEDAYVLARCCDEVANVEAALKTYQSLRRPRVVRAIEAANANARNYHLRGLKRQVAHMGLWGMGKLAPNAFLNRLSWLYDHDVTA